MTISRKREILRQMIEGQFPTEVIRNKSGGIIAKFDRLAALQLDAKLAGEFAPERHEIIASNLKLTFKIQGRNTRPDVIDAEIVEEDEMDRPALTEQNYPINDMDFSQYENSPIELDQTQITTL
jgi:hypothetical protein